VLNKRGLVKRLNRKSIDANSSPGNRSLGWMMTAAFALLMALSGCAHIPQAHKEGERKASPHKVGDFAVYKYSGSHLPLPVFVRYEVAEVDGLLVRFMVRATAGDQERLWMQDLRDTLSNRASNKMEAIYVERNGEWAPLPNVDNKDLFALYAWTLPKGSFRQGGTPFPYASSSQLGQDAIPTTCVDVDGHLGQTPATMNRCESEDFPWLHIEATLRAQATGDILWKVELESFGQML